MKQNWATAIDDARRLANTARSAEHPEQHILGLVECITDLCAAVEDLAVKSGLSRQDAQEDARRE